MYNANVRPRHHETIARTVKTHFKPPLAETCRPWQGTFGEHRAVTEPLTILSLSPTGLLIEMTLLFMQFKLDIWCPVWAAGCNAPLVRFFISALYCLLVYIVYFPTYSFFFTFFLSYLLPYLSFPLKIDPLHFQAACRKRRLNLGLVFCIYFVL